MARRRGVTDMKLTGENRINASPEEVWRALNDPEILKQAIPGCDTLEKISDTQFKATVTTKIGPVQAKFTGEVELTDLDPPRGYTISGKGSGGVAGNARGGAKVKLEPDGNGTKLSYDVDAQVTGKLAQLGSRLIDSTAKMLAGQFFNKFEALVSKPEEPKAAAAPATSAAAAVASGAGAAASSAAAHRPSAPTGSGKKEKGIPAWFWAVAISLFIVLFSYYFKK
jgi:carbon monoxide dehydrogenase subunit G